MSEPGEPHKPPEEPSSRVVLDGLPPERPLRRRLLRWGLFAALAAVNAALVAAVVGWIVFSRGLPDIPTLEQYRPPIITEMISADGQIAGEFFVERRKVVPYERIPKRVIQAFIASEDKNFFEHGGIDLLGTLRAAVKTYVLRSRIQGASTLTQQTAKAILISAEGFERGTERSLRRKIRELILARRLEARFTKEQILWMYLNGVYLGHHSYGVQSAAENYYRKNVEDLTLEEAALIAGLPQAPSRYSPFSRPEAASERRRYVLRRMAEEGMITEAERRSAEKAEVKVFGVDDVFRETAPFYVETVRRQVVDRYGNERLLHDGLRVEMAMDLEKQRAAQAAVLKGLVEVDQRQGFTGPVAKVAGAERTALAARLAKAWPKGTLHAGDYCVGIVDRVDDKAGIVEVEVGETRGVLPISGMRWARRPNPVVSYADSLLSRPSSALRAGDVVVLKRVERAELQRREAQLGVGRPKDVPEAPVLFSLQQDPTLQGALVAVDPGTAYVTAMVGGYDFEASEFNRAFQACRQPGSAFKPVVYSAAVEKLDYTPATILTDAPIVFRDDESSWKPQNYGEDFKGDVTLRTALVNSMNIPAVKTAEALNAKLGPAGLGDWAKTLGITTPVKQELGSALGSSCVTPWELTNVYALFARYGEKRPSTFVKRVLDRDGRVLEDHADYRDPWVGLDERLAGAVAEVTRPREQVMDPRSAYILVRLMREVATVGTGARAAALGKPAAGKTGTTNDSFDTWFMGFTRDLATGVWLGYDVNVTPLGRYETGGHAALPIWLDFMSAALKGRAQPEFEAPSGIVEVRIDPASGKAVADGAGGVPEPFKQGTEPVLADAEKKQVEVQDLFMQ
ncbi:penicillin-binding protein 1A [Anaeromyxobacter sp. PSR-1]|uniref:penicillin-binding protein 1A n=1 Tax=Anaeromyxobacter sp. PSR-1 TaxID=1300915 RepID=UPI0005E960D9|nr:PBP1A family penicillin-binding protein [Anaeromyxobacter sp. PSR-1]GAO01587.1 penicillin-binding protein 1A [Anaeromyxobacter sp. PSR-1]